MRRAGSAAFVLAGFAALWLAELRWPLRRSTEAKSRRFLRNIAIAGCGAVATQVCEAPITRRIGEWVVRNRRGLLQKLPLPKAAELLLGLVLMDYTLYAWHVLTHKVAFLWRFHAVHHADLDLDASTALRFHFGELILSVPYRAGQIAIFGITPSTLSVWRTALVLSILFHHSNVRLPPRIERLLSRFVMTPRLHGIHHSARASERDSNWSSGLSLWDYLHGTLRTDVPQGSIRIGIEDTARPEQVTLARMLSPGGLRPKPAAGRDHEPLREP